MSEPRDPLQSLLERVPPRPEPPPEVRRRVLAAVEQEWRRHRRRRWRLPVGLAAAVAASLVVGLLVTGADGGIQVVVHDTAGLEVDGGRYREGDIVLHLAPGTGMTATGPTRLAAAGTDLRLRGGTRLSWLNDRAVTLARGALYVDTGGLGRFDVHTPLGLVSDIGTRFMVTLGDDGMEVALREGAASIDTEHGTYTASAYGLAGDVVVVTPEQVVTLAEPASAPRWAWIHEVHPGYDQRDVVPLLREIAGDLGLHLDYESPAVQAAALQGRLEGDLADMAPEEALEVVLATSGFAGRREAADRLVIAFQSATN